MEIEKLIRKNILSLKPYSSARDEFKGTASVFLDANENPYGSPVQENYNRYPDPLQKSLKKEISAWKNCKTENIFIGNGSDEAIDVLFRIFCNPNEDKVIICPPTYGMYEVSANINAVETVKVPMTKDFDWNAEAILSQANEKTKILFICSPNNPSGNMITEEKLKLLVENFLGIVVVDEAYIDFSAQKSVMQWINEYKNLAVLQTFSKAFGMAGLRIGMAFANENLINWMNKVKAPYNLNSFSIAAGIDALKNRDKIELWVTQTKNEKQKIINELTKFDFIIKIFPSEANFLLVKFKNANVVYDYLLGKGIVVRNRSTQLNCENTLRITIGTPTENENLLNALKEFTI